MQYVYCMYFENREVKNGLKSFLRSTQPSKNTWRQQSFSEFKYNLFDPQIHPYEVIVIGGIVYIKYTDLEFNFATSTLLPAIFVKSLIMLKMTYLLQKRLQPICEVRCLCGILAYDVSTPKLPVMALS